MNNEFSYAQKGKFIENKGVPVLILKNGETIRNSKNKITNFKFSKSDFILKNLKANTITQQKNQEMRTIDVISCVVFIYNIKIKSLSKKFDENVNCSQSNKINMLKRSIKIIFLLYSCLILIPYSILKRTKKLFKIKNTRKWIGSNLSEEL